MLKGNMTLNVMEAGKPRSIPIKEGEVFLLPARVPHSPQREADTIGLVLERERLATEQDGLRWYVPGTSDILFEDWFHCTDLGKQLKPIIEAFHASEAHTTGVPARDYSATQPPVEVDDEIKVGHAVPLHTWMARYASSGYAYLTGDDEVPGGHLNGDAQGVASHESGCLSPGGEYTTIVARAGAAEEWVTYPGEVFIWCQHGACTVSVQAPEAGDASDHALAEGEVMLVPAGHSVKTVWTDVGDSLAAGWIVSNRKVPESAATQPAAAATAASSEH